MAKKYKGFKSIRYNKTNNKVPKYRIEREAKLMARAMLSKMGIDSKYY